jgi:hypothetical protein
MGTRCGERGLEAETDPQTDHNDDNWIRHLPLFWRSRHSHTDGFSISNYLAANGDGLN